MVKALSIWQPWSSLVGIKMIETRGWLTHYRGELLICAAKQTSGKQALYLARRDFQRALAPLFPHCGPRQILMSDLPLGQAVAVVDLVDCLPVEDIADSVIRRELPFGDFTEGRFGWIFQNLRRIEPFPVTGQQGLFNVECNELIEVSNG